MYKLRIYLYRHNIISRFGAAALYGILIGVAMNFFWQPGNIYSSGFNGLSQLVDYFFPTSFLPLIIFLVNVPITLIGWSKINHKEALFEIFAIISSSFFVGWITPPKTPLINDPLMCAIFGGILNGFGTGFALRNGVATGGLDIIAIIGKKLWNIKIFPINVTFNLLIVIGLGFQHGWKYSFYSIIGIIVSAWIISLVYAQQQQMQVMIVTNKKNNIIKEIQKKLNRGSTVIKDTYGAYSNNSKNILLVVITLKEKFILDEIIKNTDSQAFAAIWKIENTLGNFKDKDL